MRHPDRYAFSVHENVLRSGERVTIFWANKGIFDDRGEVREVLRVGVDMTERKNRLRAAAQELRSMSEMLLHRRVEPIFPERIQQPTAPKHVANRIRNLGEKNLRFRLLGFSDQAQQNVRGG